MSTAVQYVPLDTDPLVREIRRTEDGDGAWEHHNAAVLTDLAAIGSKLGRPILLPDRPFSEHEKQTIAMLRAILHTGRVTRTWDSLSFATRSEIARDLVDTFSGGAIKSLGMEGEVGEAVELFGTQLPLGPTRLFAPQAKLANEQEVRARLADRRDDPTAIEFRFVPGDDKAIVSVYLDWLPTPAPDAAETVAFMAGTTPLILDAVDQPSPLGPEQSRRLTELFDRQAYGRLSDAEQRELDGLVTEYGRLLHERQLRLFAEQHGITVEQARREVEAQFDQARAWWLAFEADPSRRRALVARARRREARAIE